MKAVKPTVQYTAINIVPYNLSRRLARNIQAVPDLHWPNFSLSQAPTLPSSQSFPNRKALRIKSPHVT